MTKLEIGKIYYIERFKEYGRFKGFEYFDLTPPGAYVFNDINYDLFLCSLILCDAVIEAPKMIQILYGKK